MLGVQRPRLLLQPRSVSSAAVEAIELALAAGLDLDEWQQFALSVALGERGDGKWSAFEVCLLVPRQNGKGAVLEARELAGLFLFGEQMIIHSAHEFKTAAEAFRRVLSLVENTDELRKRVKRVRSSHGEEGIELLNGNRLRFVARSTGSGRGFSGDCVILDEAYNLAPAAMDALLPTLSAKTVTGDPQIWYTSSAPMLTSDVLHRVRRRALSPSAIDDRLAFMEWSAEDTCDPDDPLSWAQANPGLGKRISVEYVRSERAALTGDGFRRERLGIPDDPGGANIGLDNWPMLPDGDSSPAGKVAFALAVSLNGESAAIGVAGHRVDGLDHVEVAYHERGTLWVVDRLLAMQANNPGFELVVDEAGPSGAMISGLMRAGIPVRKVSLREVAGACGAFVAAVRDGSLRHRNQRELNRAVDGAHRRDVGDAWVWGRKSSTSDISPLEAVTLARWAACAVPPVPEFTGALIDLDDFLADE